MSQTFFLFAGWVCDTTGSYIAIFYILGITLIIGGGALFLANIIKDTDQRSHWIECDRLSVNADEEKVVDGDEDN